MRTVQSWTRELGYGADTMFHRTYFLFLLLLIGQYFPEVRELERFKTAKVTFRVTWGH